MTIDYTAAALHVALGGKPDLDTLKENEGHTEAPERIQEQIRKLKGDIKIKNRRIKELEAKP